MIVENSPQQNVKNYLFIDIMSLVTENATSNHYHYFSDRVAYS
jgi:hypothetical protein